MIDDTATVTRCEVFERRTHRGVLVLRTGGTAILSLQGTASALWDALDRPAAFGSLVARLATDHHAVPDHIRADVARAVRELETGGVVRVG